MAEINSFISSDALKEAERYLTLLNEANSEMAKMATQFNNLAKATQNEVKQETDLIKKEQQLEVLNQKKIKTQKDEIALKDKLTAAAKKVADATLKENSAYEKLKKAQSESVKKARELAAQYGVNSQQAKKAALEADKYSKKLKEVNNTTGAPATNNVGKYFQAIMKGAAALGLVTGAAAILKKVWDGLVTGSQAFGDKWAATMGLMEGATSAFFSMVGSGNLDDFIDRIKQAAKAGKEYKQALDDLYEGGLSLKIAEAESKLFQAEQNKILKSATATKDQRIAAGKAMLEDEKKLTELRLHEGTKLFEAESARIEKIQGINSEMLVNFIRNYRNDGELRSSIDEKNIAIQEALNITFMENVKTTNIDALRAEKKAKADIIRSSFTDEEKVYMAFYDKYQGSTDEMVGKVIESYTKLTDIKTQQLTETQRASTALDAQLASNSKEKVKTTEQLISDELESEEGLYDGLNTMVKNNIDDKKAAKEKEKAIEDEFSSYMTNLVDNKESENKTAADKEIKLAQRVADEKIYIEEQVKAKKEELRQAEWDAVQTIGNALFEIGANNREKELMGIEQDYANRIELAEGNADIQKQLEDQLAAEKLRIAQEQAQSQKNAALFNIGITAAQRGLEIYGSITAATAAAAVGGPVTAAIWAPFIAASWAQLGILGAATAAQTAAVLSAPLPEFFKGTSDTPFAFTAGERGSELMRLKDGTEILTPDKKTPYIGKEFEHATIIPNRETQQILANRQMKNDNRELVEKLDRVVNAIERNAPRISFSRNVGKLNVAHHNRKYGIKG